LLNKVTLDPVIDADGNRIYVHKDNRAFYRVNEVLRNGTYKPRKNVYVVNTGQRENCLYNVHPRNKKFYFFGGKTSKRKTSKRKTSKRKTSKPKTSKPKTSKRKTSKRKN
jgi:hypothetical protein